MANAQTKYKEKMKSNPKAILSTPISSHTLFIPEWSEYMSDPNLPTIKLRERHYKTDNSYILELEITSTEYATGNFTASTCNENRTMNGWKTVSLQPNKPHKIKFQTTNSCNNGWWWQVNGYRILTDWTTWTNYDANGLRARMKYTIGKNGNKYLELQIDSKNRASLECAIKVCENDNIAQNGWRKISIEYGNNTINFPYNNTCDNGWWWEYRNYQKKKGLLEDDMILNPVD